MAVTIPNYGPVRGKVPGVAAIDFDGGRYCIDCAAKVMDGRSFSYEASPGGWVGVTDADGEDIVEALISGEINTLSSGGVVLKHSLGGEEEWHCGRGGNCVHAIDGESHEYDHDEAIGVRLNI